jgi:hypothetical protein
MKTCSKVLARDFLLASLSASLGRAKSPMQITCPSRAGGADTGVALVSTSGERCYHFLLRDSAVFTLWHTAAVLIDGHETGDFVREGLRALHNLSLA